MLASKNWKTGSEAKDPAGLFVEQLFCKYVRTYGHTCDEQNPKKLGPGDWCGLVTSPGFLGGLRGLASTGQ